MNPELKAKIEAAKAQKPQRVKVIDRDGNEKPHGLVGIKRDQAFKDRISEAKRINKRLGLAEDSPQTILRKKISQLCKNVEIFEIMYDNPKLTYAQAQKLYVEKHK